GFPHHGYGMNRHLRPDSHHHWSDCRPTRAAQERHRHRTFPGLLIDEHTDDVAFAQEADDRVARLVLPDRPGAGGRPDPINEPVETRIVERTHDPHRGIARGQYRRREPLPIAQVRADHKSALARCDMLEAFNADESI